MCGGVGEGSEEMWQSQGAQKLRPRPRGAEIALILSRNVNAKFYVVLGTLGSKGAAIGRENHTYSGQICQT